MLSSTLLSQTVFVSVFLFLHDVVGMTVVEGFIGGPAILPCSLKYARRIQWRQGHETILSRYANGQVVRDSGPYSEDVSLVYNSANLRIDRLDEYRDSNWGLRDKVFTCEYFYGGGSKEVQLRLLARITSARIKSARYPWTHGGRLNVTAGIPETFTCSVTGYPNPPPSYSWTVDGVIVDGQRSSLYRFTPKKSTRTIKCTATNKYSNATVLSVKNATVSLDIMSSPDPLEVEVSYDKPTQTVTCTVDGDIDDYTSCQWEHRLGGKLLQQFGLETVLKKKGTCTLKLRGTLTYEDTGNYVCQVSNRFKNPLRKEVFVTPQTAAVFGYQSSSINVVLDKKTTTISVPFYTYSETPNVKVVWKKSGETTALTSHQEKTGTVRLMVGKQIVSIEGTVTVLTLRDATRSDEGNHTLTVTNYIDGEYRSTQTWLGVYVKGSTEAPSRTTAFPLILGGVAGGILILVVAALIVKVLIMLRKYIVLQNTEQGAQDKGPPLPKRPKGFKAKLLKKGGFFAKAGKKSNVNPRETDVIYAEIMFNKGKSTSSDRVRENANASNEKGSPKYTKRAGLTYDQTYGSAIIPPRRDSLTYADIDFVKK